MELNRRQHYRLHKLEPTIKREVVARCIEAVLASDLTNNLSSKRLKILVDSMESKKDKVIFLTYLASIIK
jgi:hypothetical protein